MGKIQFQGQLWQKKVIETPISTKKSWAWAGGMA
jgi:hypothetical protein